MIYGYSRVSTLGQVRGNSLAEQRAELKKNGCEVIIEEQYTGSTTARPKFEKLVKEQLQSGDTLIVTKLDRFARNVLEGIATIRELFDKGVRIHVLNVGLLENTSMGKFFIQTLLAVAELERSLIAERTAAGKEIARTRDGYKEGRPPVPRERITHAISLLDSHTYKEVSSMTGLSVSTLTRYRRKLLQNNNNPGRL